MLKTCIIERFEQSNKHVIAIRHRVARACCYEQLLLGLRSTELHRKNVLSWAAFFILVRQSEGAGLGLPSTSSRWLPIKFWTHSSLKGLSAFPTGSKVISGEVTSGTVLIYKGFLLRSSVTSAIGSFEWWVSFLLWEMSPLQDFLLSAFFPL